MDIRIDGRMDVRTHGRTDGREDKQGRTDGLLYSDGVTHTDHSMELFAQFLFLPSRDAVDDRFQRTLDVLTGITME